MMKMPCAAAAVLVFAATTVCAAPARVGPGPGCGTGATRVALTTDPAPCCAGTLACPRLLANTGLDKAKRPNRT